MKSLARILFVFVSLILGAAVVHAQDLNAVKARMAQRQAAVDAMKERGAAGESNRGFLEARGGASGEDQKVIADENNDRRTVYAALASQTQSDAETVGRRRAQQIASGSKPGVWIQDPSGEWRQKS